MAIDSEKIKTVLIVVLIVLLILFGVWPAVRESRTIVPPEPGPDQAPSRLESPAAGRGAAPLESPSDRETADAEIEALGAALREGSVPDRLKQALKASGQLSSEEEAQLERPDSRTPSPLDQIYSALQNEASLQPPKDDAPAAERLRAAQDAHTQTAAIVDSLEKNLISLQRSMSALRREMGRQLEDLPPTARQASDEALRWIESAIQPMLDQIEAFSASVKSQTARLAQCTKRLSQIGKAHPSGVSSTGMLDDACGASFAQLESDTWRMRKEVGSLQKAYGDIKRQAERLGR